MSVACIPIPYFIKHSPAVWAWTSNKHTDLPTFAIIILVWYCNDNKFIPVQCFKLSNRHVIIPESSWAYSQARLLRNIRAGFGSELFISCVYLSPHIFTRILILVVSNCSFVSNIICTKLCCKLGMIIRLLGQRHQ